MQVDVTDKPLEEVDADVRLIGLCEGEQLPTALAGTPGAADVKTAFKKAMMLRPDDESRVLVVGFGKREELDAERARVAAAIGARGAAQYGAKAIAWAIPDVGDRARFAAGVVEGTILAGYSFDRFRAGDDEEPGASGIETLTLSDAPGEEIAEEAKVAHVAAEAANRARELQNLPANVLKPESLAERAREIAAGSEKVQVTVFDREEINERGMGGLAAVSSGAAAEPRLIALRYSGGGSETIGLVGKGVTFDAGGISIKPAAGMQEMKMDMSGAAAVLEAFAAIVELGLPLDIAAVVPATENMLDAGSMRPGDIITQLNGKTVEVNNTDAEGRLILADALAYCVREMGAARVLDLATLTGAVVVALGSTYSALIANDDDWAAAVAEAGERSGELAWRLPLHPEYKDLTRGKVADLTNAATKRKAGTIYAASFLEEFVDAVPWAHLDIAGTAWDVGREYVGNGATGTGVRLIVELARELAA